MRLDYDKLPRLPDDTRAAERDDVLFSIAYALASGPYKLCRGNESGYGLRQAQDDRQRTMAEHILKHLELSAYRFGKGPPAKSSGTPDYAGNPAKPRD